MDENSAFNKALSGMVYDVACKKAIRHLYDLGYSCERIRQELTYPAGIEVIEKEIALYREEKERTARGEVLYDFEPYTDRLGRVSYRRVERHDEGL